MDIPVFLSQARGSVLFCYVYSWSYSRCSRDPTSNAIFSEIFRYLFLKSIFEHLYSILIRWYWSIVFRGIGIVARSFWIQYLFGVNVASFWWFERRIQIQIRKYQFLGEWRRGSSFQRLPETRRKSPWIRTVSLKSWILFSWFIAIFLEYKGL